MKVFKWGITLLVAGIISSIGIVSIANAQRFSNDVGAGETVNSTLYSSGKTVSVKGTINGDVFCAGQTVDIDAVVRGDVICVGQDVTISGRVDGDVRVAGQKVSVSADVRRNLSVAGDSFSLDATAKVGQDITAVGNLMNLKGSVGRDAVVSGTRGVLNGQIARNVKFDGSFLELKSGAKILGNLTYTSDSEADKAKESVVAGKTEHKKPEQKRGGLLAFSFAWYLYILSALLAIGMIIALLAPRAVNAASDIIVKQWGKPLVTGIVVSLLAPIVMIVLAVTIVGIPLAVILLVAWLMLMTLSGPVAGYFVGRLILGNKQKNIPLRMLLGGFVLVTLYFVPVLGFFVMLGGYWLGSGAVLVGLKRLLGKPKYSAS